MWGMSKITAKWIGSAVPGHLTVNTVYIILWADTGGANSAATDSIAIKYT